jgi:hypothetical protein
MRNQAIIVVLNDGETWSGIGGCQVVAIDGDIFERDCEIGDIDVHVRNAAGGYKVPGYSVIADLTEFGGEA